MCVCVYVYTVMAAMRDRKEMPLPTENSGVHLRRRSLRSHPTVVDAGDLLGSSRGDHSDGPPQGSTPFGQASKADKPFQKMENTYKVDPDPEADGDFSTCAVERVCEAVLVDRLTDCQYEPAACRQLSQELASVIMDSIKQLKIKRYKVVAVVSIGSLKERPGLQFGSRCLWNDATDTFASVKFTNGSLFAVAMVYGLYYE